VSGSQAGGAQIRVLIADDQALIRSGLAMVVGSAEDIVVIAEAADGEQAVALSAQLRPDVVLMDVQMPRLDGIEATKRIVAARPETRVIVLTTFDLDAYAFGGLDAGASGFLLKDSTSAAILAAIRAVARGDAALSPRVTRALLDRFGGTLAGPGDSAPRDVLAALTDRERDVFFAVARGLSNTEIATELWLSESTVKTHVGRVFQKLELRDRVQAVLFAHRHGLG
jgi:DNA-binding NarL/FixJ family response regulator